MDCMAGFAFISFQNIFRGIKICFDRISHCAAGHTDCFFGNIILRIISDGFQSVYFSVIRLFCLDQQPVFIISMKFLI